MAKKESISLLNDDKGHTKGNPDDMSREKLEKTNLSPDTAAPDTAAALESVASTMTPPNPDIDALPKLTDAPETEEKAGAAFDATIHEVDGEGKPVLTPTGRFKKKKGVGRVRLHVPDTDTAEQKKAANAAAQRRMAASMVVDSFISSGVMVFGDEWLPEIQKVAVDGKEFSISERESLIEATDLYMAAKNIQDIPPGLCLTLVVSSYCLKRVNKPKTREKLSVIVGGIRGKIGNIFNRIKGVIKKK